MSDLHTAMAKAFPEIEGAAKDRNNPAFKSKYADLSSVVEAVKPALVKNSLFFVQLTHEQQGGVCIETVVHHSGGQSMSFGKLFVPAGKQDAQGYGSALTYARRYSLMTAFGVCPEDDDGNAAAKSPPSNDHTPDPREPAPREKLEGKYTSKSTLQAAIKELALKLGKAGTAEQIDALESEYKDAILQCHRDLPAWWEGDGGDKRGLRGQIEDARASLGGMYGELVRSMKESATLKSLTAWMAANETVIDGLNDIDRRRFERERDVFEAGLTAVARRNAG